MGGRSRSSTTQETENTQIITTENTSLSDFEGIGVADANDVQITVSDQGAIMAGRDIALAGLDANAGVVDQAFLFGVDALDFGESIARDATNTLGSAISKVANATRSDASQTIDKIVKTGAIIAALATFAFIVSRA